MLAAPALRHISPGCPPLPFSGDWLSPAAGSESSMRVHTLLWSRKQLRRYDCALGHTHGTMRASKHPAGPQWALRLGGGGRQISALFGRVSNSGVLPFFPRLGTSPVTFRQQRARTHLDAAHTYVPASACTAVRGGTRTRAPNPSPPRAAHAATGARARLRARAPARAGEGGRGRGRRGGARERAS